MVTFTLRKTLKFALVLILSAVVTLFAAFFNRDFDEYRKEIAAAVAAATGRDVSIKGRVTFSFIPRLTLKVSKVSLSNAAWGTRPTMATFDEFQAEVDLLPFLWSRTVRLDRLVLRGVDVLLETDAKNHGNWDFTPARDAKRKPSKTAPQDENTLLADLGRVRLERIRFAYRNGLNGRTLAGHIDRMELRAEGNGLNAMLVATYNGQKVDVNGRIGRLSQLLMPSAPWPIKIEAASGETRIGVEGTIVEPLIGRGISLAVRAEGRNLAGIGALTGVEILKSRPFALAATVSGDISAPLTVSNLVLNYGGSKLSGAGRLGLQPRPRLEAKFKDAVVDLADVGLTLGRKRGGGDPDRLFEDKPIKLDALKAIDLNLALEDARVTLDPLTFQKVSGRVMVDAGRLTVDRVDGEFAGGKLVGGLTIDARAPEVGFKTVFRIHDVDAAKLSRALGDKQYFAGGLGGRVDIEGKGRSWREIMAGLNGGVEIGMGKGRINPEFAGYVDMIADLLPSLGDDPKRPRGTDVTCFVGRFAIKDGVANADALMLDTGRATVRGAGAIKLGTENIDIWLKPNSIEKRLVAVSVPLHIQGTLLKPIVLPDEGTVAAGVAGAVAGAALGPIGLLIPLISALRSSEQVACAPELERVTAKAKGAAMPASSAPPPKSK